jgi:imidazolonepropionase-like amidohydrolase
MKLDSMTCAAMKIKTPPIGPRVSHLLLWLSVFSILVPGLPRQPEARAEAITALVGGTIIDGNGGPPIHNGVVVIKGDRIERVGNKDKIKLPTTATVIDTTGKYVLPGLIDVHVHYSEWMGEMFLAHGVTTVKDVGNYVEWISVARDEINQGKARGPRIFYAGNGLDTPPPRRDHFIGLTRPEMARRVVQLLHQRGAVAIKVREHMTVDLLRAITEEAHTVGMKVTGHLRATDARQAALAGIDGLEHASGIVQATVDPSLTPNLENLKEYDKYVAERKSYSLINMPRAEDLDTLLVSRKVALIPTLSGWWRMATVRRDDFAREDAAYAKNPALAYVPADVRAIWATSALYKLENPDDLAQVRLGYKNIQAILRQHYQAGGQVLAGSDTFVSVPGLSTQRELLFLVDSGFTPMQAISIATHDNARFLGQEPDLGTIAPGKLADIIVVNANPLEDIRRLQPLAIVIKGGQIVDTTYHANDSVPTPRPKLERPLWIEKQLMGVRDSSEQGADKRR